MSASESLVLALDGSTRTCTSALLRPDGGASGRPPAGGRRAVRRRRPGNPPEEDGWSVASRRVSVDDRGQAKVLLRQVDEMLGELGAEPKDLLSIVVGTGPGTFTGVRIAVATARALALALSVPVGGVSTLAALAAGAAQRHVTKAEEVATFLVPVVDARRNQVFYGVYAPVEVNVASAKGRWVRQGEFAVCERAGVADALGEATVGRSIVVGASRALVGELPAGCEFVSAEVEAEYLVLGQGSVGEPWLDMNGTMAGKTGTPESVSPIYVRSPDADVHITKMRDPWANGGDRAKGKG